MKLISALVSATRIVQFLFYLNPKFQASSSFLCLYRPVCVGPVQKPHCWFSHEAAHLSMCLQNCRNGTSLHGPLCKQCCHTDLCNAALCGEPGTFYDVMMTSHPTARAWTHLEIKKKSRTTSIPLSKQCCDSDHCTLQYGERGICIMVS